MNVSGNSDSIKNSNILSLFSHVKMEEKDTLTELLQEAESEAWEEEVVVPRNPILVTETQFPDQSMYTLEQQLESLKENMGRLKFYLSDLNDLLPMKIN
jgi:hypothetical protein